MDGPGDEQQEVSSFEYSRMKGGGDTIFGMTYRLARVIWRQVVAIALIVLVAGVASLYAAEKVTLEKSVAVMGKKADKSAFAGRVVAYDDQGFELRTKAGEVEKVA